MPSVDISANFNDKKLCSSCKSDSYRAEIKELGNKSMVAIPFIWVENERRAQDLGGAFAYMYVCSNCGHADFYSVWIPKAPGPT